MDGTVALALAQSLITSVASGISSISIQNNELVFQFKDGTSQSMLIPVPADGEDGTDGVSIQSVTIDEDGQLICLLSNGTLVNAGVVPNPVVFKNNTNELPVEGQIHMVYIVGTSIFIWDGTKYILLSSGKDTTVATQWGSF